MIRKLAVLYTHACESRGSKAFSGVCVPVCSFVSTIKPKRLKVQSPNYKLATGIVHHESSSIIGSKGQRSRLRLGLWVSYALCRVSNLWLIIHMLETRVWNECGRKVKPGFHYPSWRPELDGPSTRLVETRARQHGPCWRVMETGHSSTRAVNSGSGNRA